MNRQRIITAGLIALGVVVAAFFGMRTLRALKHFHRPGLPFDKPPSANQTDVEFIRDWMTLPYIADTYDTPPDALFISLGLPPGKQNGRKSLKQLNDEYFPNQPDVVLNQVKAAIGAFQSQTMPPRPLSPSLPPTTP
jgi:hypothetical protein